MLGEVRKFVEGLGDAGARGARPDARVAAVAAVLLSGGHSPETMAELEAAVDRMGCVRSAPEGVRGDAILFTSDAPTRCVRACIAIRERATQLGIDLRIGAHLGDDVARASPERHVAAEIAAASPSLSIRMTKALVDVLPGSGLRFAPVDVADGVHALVE